jgi:hypothetical protein
MSDWRNPRTVEHRGKSLSFALGLVDAFTGAAPEHHVDVSLATPDADPVVNPSGYHVFVDLEPDAVTLTVDGGDRYVDREVTVVLSGDVPDDAAETVFVVTDPAEPLVVECPPTPAYEFPANTTVVRGHVEDGDGAPVAGATVTLQAFEPAVETTETGEFALWVPATGEQVRRRDGRNVVVADEVAGDGGLVGDGGTDSDPTLAVSHPAYDDHVERLTVEAGTRTVHYVTLE